MTWIPEHEIYCSVCRRMVAANGLRPAVHYRFNMSASFGERRDATACRGSHNLYTPLRFTHGMEDTAAGFWPTQPDTHPEPEATPEPPAVSHNSAPGPGARFSFIRHLGVS